MDRMVLSRGRTQYNSMLARYGLTPVIGSMFDEFAVGVHDVVFQSGVPGLDYPRPPHPEVVQVGALLPHMPDPSTVLPYPPPHPGQPVVVVSQGTVDNVDLDKLLIPAVEALAPTGAFVIAATGGRDTAALRERFAFPNVVVEDWVPFGAVLPHADLMISNGGYGSVLFALSNGVPLVVAGTREGKNDINARVSYTGAGIDLRTETPSAARIARAATAVLTEPRYREHARRIQQEIGQYDPMGIIVTHLEHAMPDAWLGTAEKVPLTEREQ
jgi:UDP:flavonoid glycosyltransferase YjiC (YdhE family)